MIYVYTTNIISIYTHIYRFHITYVISNFICNFPSNIHWYVYFYTWDVHTSYIDFVILEKLKNSDLKSIYILLLSSLQKDVPIKLRNFILKNLGLLCLLKFLSLILNRNLTFKCRTVNRPLVSLVDCNHVWLVSSRVRVGDDQGSIFPF